MAFLRPRSSPIACPGHTGREAGLLRLAHPTPGLTPPRPEGLPAAGAPPSASAPRPGLEPWPHSRFLFGSILPTIQKTDRRLHLKTRFTVFSCALPEAHQGYGLTGPD